MNIKERLKSRCPHELILGTSGSGKSYIAKKEIKQICDSTFDDIFVIDTTGEYKDYIYNLNGTIIKFGNDEFCINIMDLDYENEYFDQYFNPVIDKSDFIISLFSLLLEQQVSPMSKSIIDSAVKKTYDTIKNPTICDLKTILETFDDSEELVNAILPLCEKKCFSNQTNIDMEKRIISFDISNLDYKFKNIAFLIGISLMNKKMHKNTKKMLHTWFYIDEFYSLLENENVAYYFTRIWKTSRKYWGIMTGITQNIEDLLKSQTGRAITCNTLYITLLNQFKTDIENIKVIFGIPEEKIEYILGVERGKGLLLKECNIEII